MSVQNIRHNHILIEQDRRSHKGVALRERRDWITTEIDLATEKKKTGWTSQSGLLVLDILAEYTILKKKKKKKKKLVGFR